MLAFKIWMPGARLGIMMRLLLTFSDVKVVLHPSATIPLICMLAVQLGVMESLPAD